MIITFCGHSDFYEARAFHDKMMQIITETAKGESVDFYLGGYGRFDDFAYSCAKEYKSAYPDCRLIFVTPYMGISYLRHQEQVFDEVIFPDIENVPHRFRISKRNEYMVNSADLVIAYVTRAYGGAYKTLQYASKINKSVVNIV